jgi:hypothetical protein
MNEVLAPREIEVADPAADIRSGVVLVMLLEEASGLRIAKWNREPATKAQEIENLNIALKFMCVLGC